MKNEIIEKAIQIAGSQAKLAELSGVSQSAIHKLLTSKNGDMRCSTAHKLAKATGLSVMSFINLTL